MTRTDLQMIFDQNGVPTSYYSFRGAGGGDCYALEFLDNCWTLSYYDERGFRLHKGTYPSEDEGCRAMFAAVAEMVQLTDHRTIHADIQ